jgi:hypothetical protein
MATKNMARTVLLLTMANVICPLNASQVEDRSDSGVTINRGTDLKTDPLYNAFFGYVQKNTPFFDIDNEIQQKIADNNMSGLLELFFNIIGDRPNENISRLSESMSHQQKEIQEVLQKISALATKDEVKELLTEIKDLKQRLETVEHKSEILTTHTGNVLRALKDNKTLKAEQKYGGKH